MPNSSELIERAIYSFRKVQRRMLLAKEENAVKMYEDLKDEYVSLKAILNSLGVNITEIDIIKE